MTTALAVVVFAVLMGLSALLVHKHNDSKNPSTVRHARVIGRIYFPLLCVGTLASAYVTNFNVSAMTTIVGFFTFLMSAILSLDAWLNWTRSLDEKTSVHDDTLRA